LLSGCDDVMLRLEEAPGLRTAARADTGVPFALERTDRVRVTPFGALGGPVELRVGVRVAAPGEAEVLVVESREGVPGLRPIEEDILAMCM